MFVAEDHARQRLDLDVEHGRPLMLREIAHLGLRKFDVVDIALRQLRQAVLDLGIGQPKILSIPMIEFDRQFANRLVAALFDVGQDGLDGRANPGFVLGAQRRVSSALENLRHRTIPCVWCFTTRFADRSSPGSSARIPAGHRHRHDATIAVTAKSVYRLIIRYSSA
jgi:hypothetical protein